MHAEKLASEKNLTIDFYKDGDIDYLGNGIYFVAIKTIELR